MLMPHPARSLVRRYCVFAGGLIFLTLGVVLTTVARLGTNAASSLPYVLTFVFPNVSMGTITFFVNLALLAGQVLILRREFKPIQLLQIPATFVFSFCLDLWMFLLRDLAPVTYPARCGFLLLSCVALGLGVALEVLPDVLVLPGEGFVKVLSKKYGWNFGLVKTVYDVLMVVSAGLISLLCLGGIFGLREGTLVTALVVGSIVRFFQKQLGFLVPRQEEPSE